MPAILSKHDGELRRPSRGKWGAPGGEGELLYTFAMRISFYATLRKIVGEKHVELPLPSACSLVEVLEAVVTAYPELREEVLDERGELDRYVHLFVDGRSSKFLPDGMQTVVDGTQTLEFFPAVAGG